MESVDRLRDWLKGRLLLGNGWNELNEIADAIEREVGEMQRALTIDMQPMTDENMAEHGWVLLPVDADGKPIRIGDVMEWPDCSTAEVVGIGDGTFFYIEDGEDAAEWSCAGDKIHHHAPTVEDVLREVVTLCHNTWKDESAFRFYDVDDVMESGNIAEFAAKLRLAGDGE